MTPNLDFKVTPLFDAEYFRNVTRFTVSTFNGILIATYLDTPYSSVSF